MLKKYTLNDIGIPEMEVVDQIQGLNEILGKYESYIPGEEMNQLVWHNDTTQTTIYYVDDFIIDLSYFIIEYAQEAHVQKAIANIETKIKLFTQEQILDKLKDTQKSVQEYALFIKRLAVTLSESHDYDEALFEVFCTALKSPSELVRFHTIFALSYLNWLEFVPFLEKLIPLEKDPDVKNAMQRLVEGYQKFLT
ncbi:MAG TPA: hypothetical protein DCS93_36620 [Microscillaceae bacterium]|nr:hypothetical protein [Microscillaceae bacterium]